mgnify:FL=1
MTRHPHPQHPLRHTHAHKRKHKRQRHAFTLVELIIAIGVVAAVAATSIALIGPKNVMISVSNVQRQIYAHQLENSLAAYQVDRGDIPKQNTISTDKLNPTPICKQSIGTRDSSCYPIGSYALSDYISLEKINDPAEPCSSYTGYGLYKDPTGRILVTISNLGHTSGESLPLDHCLADTLAPDIMKINITAIGGDEATVTFETDEPAYAQVQFGTSRNYSNSTSFTETLQVSHSLTIRGLSQSTTYYVRVRAIDPAGNLYALDGNIPFTTLDITPPFITAVIASGLSYNSAYITWNTDEPATSLVEYGKTIAYDKRAGVNANLDLAHQMQLTGLKGDTTYHYRVTSADVSNNSATSNDGTFTTPSDTVPPIISAITSVSTDGVSATIKWRTDEDADSQVEYGQTTSYGSVFPAVADTVYGTGHTITITGLTPNQLYHFRVKSKDESGNAAQSGDASFATTDNIPPVVVSGPNSVTGNLTGTSALIAWTTNEMTTAQVKWGTASGVYDSQTSVNGALVADHAIRILGLVPQTTYYYVVLSRDAAGNLTTSSEQSFVTRDTLPPVIANVVSVSTNGNSATITWTTDENADTQVDYGTTTSYGPRQPLIPADPQGVTSHTVVLSALTVNTLYHFRIRSTDALANMALSDDFTFTTTDITPPVIVSGPVISNNTGTSAVITWTTDEPSTTQIAYGPTSSYGNTTTFSGSYVLTHRQTVVNITPKSTVNFQMRSRDAAGNILAAPNATFVATSLDPVFSNITVSGITQNVAVIKWTTDVPSDTQVYYSTDNSLSQQSTLDPALTTSHTVRLTGLTAATTYNFVVRSKDVRNYQGISSNQTFATATPPYPDLIHYWKFDEPSGTVAYNSSGNTETGALVGGAVFDSATPPANFTDNGSLKVMASNRYVRIKNIPSDILTKNRPGTMMAWIKATPSGNYQTVFNRGSWGSDGMFALTVDGLNNTLTWNEYASRWYQIMASVRTNSWTHVAITQDGTNYRMYIDGVLRGTTAMPTAPAIPAGDLFIGNVQAGTMPFMGNIDDVRIYDKVLSQPEVAAAAASSIPADTTPPTITNVSITPTRSTAAAVITTNEPVKLAIEYGMSTSYGLITYPWTAFGTAPATNILALYPNEKVYYRISVRDLSDNLTQSSGSFTTLPPLGQDLVAYWKFDETAGAGNATDSSTYANTATKTSTSYTASTAPLAQSNPAAQVFPAGSAWIASPAMNGMLIDKSFTASLWVYPTGSGSVMGESNGPSLHGYWNQPYIDILATGQVKIQVKGLATISAGGVSFNKWNHIAFKYDQATSTLSAFVNGVKKGTSAGSRQTGWGFYETYFQFASPYDGAINLPVTTWFKGRLDEVKIYNYALHDASIISLSDQTGNWDTSAPVIVSGPQVDVTTSTATISWTTDEPSTQQLSYGVNAFTNSTLTGASLTTAHSISLNGLSAATAYQYLLQYKDGSGNAAAPVTRYFTTAGDVTPPVLSSIGATVIGAPDSMQVVWNTNEPSDSQVDYGTTTAYGSAFPIPANASLVTLHAVTLPTGSLAQGQVYHYRVRSTDFSGNTAVSADQTVDLKSPVLVSGPSVSSITGTSGIVSWTTDENSTTSVDYGTTTAYGNTLTISNSVTNHAIGIASGLSPNTIYHYRIRSVDPYGNVLTGSDATFSTDVTPPSIVSGPASSVASQSSISITWTTNENADSQVEYGITAAYGSVYPASAADTAGVTSHIVVIPGIVSGQQYHYRVKTRDLAGNLTQSVDQVFTIPDTTQPVLSALSISSITGTSAVVTWTTDEPTDAQVEYGLTTSYGTLTSIHPTPLTSHAITLTGLLPNTTYYVRARSQDAASNLGLSAGSSLKTLDTQPPLFSSVSVTILSDTSARVTWTTNKASNSQVEYDSSGSVPPYAASSTVDSAMVTSHSITLAGLASNATYHYRARSVDASNNIGYSADAVFTMPDTTPPVIGAISAVSVSDTSQSINWTTNEGADSQVEYGTTAAYGISTSLDSSLQVNHSHVITGLQGNTLYHYRIKSRDGAGNLSVSTDQTFITSDSTPPQFFSVNASNITASTAVVGWVTDESSDSQVEYGTTPSFGLATTLPTAPSTVHSVNISDLTGSTLYYFRVKSRDLAQNLGVSEQTYTFTTQPDITPPAIFNIAHGPLTDTTATITWSTNENADRQVEYGLTSNYGASTTLPTAYSPSHSVTIVGLAPNTTYQYRVKSKDIAGNLSVSQNRSFATPDTTAPVFLSVDSVTASPVTATVTWTTNEISSSQIEWGATTAYGSTTALDSGLVTSHTQTVTVPQGNQLYHFRVLSRDASGNLGRSADGILDFVPPVISAVAPLTLTGTSATLIFSTDEPSTSQIEYGTSISYGTGTTLDPTLVTTHTVPIRARLQELTTYHYRIKTKDKSGNQTVSIDYTFDTPNAPPVISAVSAFPVGRTDADISWSTDQPSDTMVEYGLTTSYGMSTAFDATLQLDHAQTLTSLTPNTLYHYRVISKDAQGGQAVSGDRTFTTLP